jgi:hypothetical protein
MASEALALRVDSHDLAKLFADAKAAEGTLQVELRRGIKAAAKPITDGIKAAAPSARIAGAVKTTASFARKGATVKVVVDSKKAPHAAPINNHDHSGTFRHPVFGNTNNWVNQAADPFFLAGARSGEAAADRQMQQVMDDVARKLGFK